MEPEGSGERGRSDKYISVKRDLDGYLIDYRWNGLYDPWFSYLSRREVDKKRWTTYYLAPLIALIVLMLVLMFITEISLVVLLVILLLATLGCLLIMAFVLNVTSFQIKDGSLEVRTRPIPLRPSRSIRCLDIKELGSFNQSYGYSFRRSYTAYTSIVAKFQEESKMVLFTIEGRRVELDYVAEELRRLLNIKPMENEKN